MGRISEGIERFDTLPHTKSPSVCDCGSTRPPSYVAGKVICRSCGRKLKYVALSVEDTKKN